MIAPITSRISSQESAQSQLDRPATYINKYGRETELCSPVLTSNQPMQLREVWVIEYLDLGEGEVCQLWDIMNNKSFQDSEADAFEYIQKKIPREWLWSVVVSRQRIDQYDRLVPCDDQAVVQVPEELLRGSRSTSNVMESVAA